MALFLWSVSLGNYFTAGVNHFIQVPNPLIALDSAAGEAIAIKPESGREQTTAGFDEKEGNLDDIVTTYDEFGGRASVRYAARDSIEAAVELVKAAVKENGGRLPNTEEGLELLKESRDPWDQPIEFRQLNSRQVRLVSRGPDRENMTQWDQGVVLELVLPAPESEDRWYDFLLPDQPWLESRKEELGVKAPGASMDENGEEMAFSFEVTHFVGGLNTLEGADYFWFFTKVMLGTAVLFVGVALLYKPREYFHDEVEDEHPIDPHGGG